MPILDAPIVAVTVFMNRARVTRRGTIALEAGEHLLILETLPETIESDSVRASGRGAGITLLGVDVKTEFVTEAPRQSVADTQKQIDELQNTLQAWKDDASTLALRQSILESFGRKSSEELAMGLGTGVTLDSVTELNAYLTEQLRELTHIRRHNTQQQNDLAKQIAALQAYMMLIQAPSQYQKRMIHVTVRADEPTEFDLEMTYAVSNASWQPIYDVRLREGGEVDLVYLANVTQQTGEDWTGVEMALSTARPALSTTIPMLPAMFIYVEDPHRQTNNMMMAKEYRAAASDGERRRMQAEAPRQAYQAPPPPPKPVAQIAQSTIEPAAGGASVTYKIGSPVTVPSDGSPHKTSVAIPTLKAKLDYVTVPKIASEAYLRATITNTSPYMLLPGNVSIFHSDEFVGKTRIGLIAPNEEFEVQLGVDDRIKVEKKLMDRDVSKRFIGFSRLVSFVYHITVTNLLPTTETINVIDQIPVPREENVKVTHDTIQPTPTEATELDVLTWKLELKPNTKQVITLGYTVEHNRDMKVIGLPD